MDFYEWWLTVDLPRLRITGDGYRLSQEAWQAAQKEAARRCAEICLHNGSDNSDYFARVIEREFGLERHE